MASTNVTEVISDEASVMDVVSEPLKSAAASGHSPTGTDQSEPHPTSDVSGRLHLASSRDRMLERVANSDGHFKHQQRWEPDLPHSEKVKIASDLLDNKPAVFLTRFGKYLEIDDLIIFKPLGDDYIINFHLEEIKNRLNLHTNQTVVRNRRYEAMKRLVADGEYFSDEELKHRDPLLYEQMVGQYLDDDEINDQVDKSDLRFSTILLKNLDMIQNNDLYKLQVDKEEAQMEESDSDESDHGNNKEDDSEEESELESEGEDEGNKKCAISSEEKKMLREEFLRTMELRFLNGEDQEFDYTKVDTNEEYDSLDIREQDEQERYFDEEEPETVDMQTDQRGEPRPGGLVVQDSMQGEPCPGGAGAKESLQGELCPGGAGVQDSMHGEPCPGGVGVQDSTHTAAGHKGLPITTARSEMDR